ncbi:MAG TPA: ATPase P [Casimicrobiaceae bacterium]|nr:ATPase P [Casimicrobiaceae bacterium]
MLEIAIPGTPLRFAHLVADFNGTLAVDGMLIAGVADALRSLGSALDIHVVTADTFGRVRQAMASVPCAITILAPGDQDSAKLRYIERLGAAGCVCIGNGRNDRLMLAAAGLGIAVIEGEGAAVETLLAARVAVPSIGTALGLLLNPARLTATLRL